MENSKYYPLRVGKFPSCIVSDMPVTHRNKKDMDNEWEHYGGFVIAESLPSDIANEFVELFNKKYGCPARLEQKACTGGQMCCQGKISHHEWVEQENAINRQNSAHSFTEGMEMDSISNDKSVFEPNKPTIDYISQSERDELVKEVYHKMSGKVPGCIYIAHAIIFAIESIDHLKRKHGR